MQVAFVGTYLPRKCGIATFTQDLRAAMAERHGPDACPVVAPKGADATHGYAVSDFATGFATVSLDAVVAAME